jgi:hypothetical protein
MAKTHEVVWDGKFIQHMPIAEAATKQAAGEVQIWAGMDGYQPGWQMKYSDEFPFAVVPPPPPVVEPEDETEDEPV